MTRLEDLNNGASVRGLTPTGLAKVVSVEWFGDQAVKITFEDATGRVSQQLIYRADQPRLEVVQEGRPWSFDGDGTPCGWPRRPTASGLPTCSIPTSPSAPRSIEPLPHQITAVYGEMLPRQPLRFLLADDPGAGKTIMAGLLIKELLIRGDLERCLIVAPGSLVEQWQDELAEKFGLDFDILTRDQIEASRHRQPVRRDEPSDRSPRHGCAASDELQAKLEAAPGLGPRRLRRGAQHGGHLLRRRSQGDQALPARASCSAPAPGTSC